jgi:hypothetical protein
MSGEWNAARDVDIQDLQAYVAGAGISWATRQSRS